MRSISFDALDETQFEGFCYDLLDSLGFINVNWRKGTGLSSSPSDRGRDIVCYWEQTEVDGRKHRETWFVDCKHYTKGVPPERLQNLLSWAEAEQPQVVLFIVSDFLSNPSKDYIDSYARNRNPSFRIKYWEKPDLERIASKKKRLLLKYDLIGTTERTIREILAVEAELTEKVWYNRHLYRMEQLAEGKEEFHPNILEGSLKSAKAVKKNMVKMNLAPTMISTGE